MRKFIIVTGGVISGLGKGIAAASIGKLLSNNFKVIPVKCEGYLNVDPGTMNPYEHGEVFVLEDGEEADMDFGHYERLFRKNCSIYSSRYEFHKRQVERNCTRRKCRYFQ